MVCSAEQGGCVGGCVYNDAVLDCRCPSCPTFAIDKIFEVAKIAAEEASASKALSICTLASGACQILVSVEAILGSECTLQPLVTSLKQLITTKKGWYLL